MTIIAFARPFKASRGEFFRLSFSFRLPFRFPLRFPLPLRAPSEAK